MNKMRVLFLGVTIIMIVLSATYFFNRNNHPQPLATIVITSYNRVELLKRAVDSAINQTYPHIEIIIVDDGSDYETLKVLKEYEKKYAHINLVALPKNSATPAFPRAVGNSVAKGKYITVLDSDDILMPTMIEKVVDFMEKNEHVTLVRVETRHYRSNQDPYTQNRKYQYPLYRLLFHSIGQGGFTFRRDFIERHNIFPNPNMTCAEDWDFIIKMVLHKASFADLSGEPLYIIREHNENKYTDCRTNSNKIHANMMRALTGSDQKLSVCDMLKKAIEFNPLIFDEQTKQDGLNAFCGAR